ncbi:MAG: lysine--tRNA ligase [Planctomycetota bacterium]|jgi:lysyl-tRNA synthetase class 2
MTQNPQQDSPAVEGAGGDPEVDRRIKLEKIRAEFPVDPYGQRTDGLITLAAARELYDADADAAQKEDADNDQRPTASVAGRIIMRRGFGNLMFMVLRDATGDLQIGVSKKAVDTTAFKLAKIADLGDIVVISGPIGSTKTGEITLWATGEGGYRLATKSLTPPPTEHYGLKDPELRYRKRYVDLSANPEVMGTFQKRSLIIKGVRDFLTDPPEPLGPAFLEVETPMMQTIAGGAAARPFTTHLNALDIDLFMRIAPELYLKRLLVGGMSRVFEINRNFRNEGIDRSHNPEFTMLELYQAFGDYNAMMDLTETMIRQLAQDICGSTTLPFGEHEIDYSSFARAPYHELFETHNGFASSDHDKLVAKAQQLDIDPAGKDHDYLLNEVWEETVEPHLVQPTFVIDYPASLCPLTKRKADRPEIAERFELFIANMELANAYTELNDPDVQLANFQTQLAGEDDEDAAFRSMDDDFIEALRVGMPPAGGLGVGIDRLVMLLTDSRSIRDVILFPLMRPAD